MLSYILVCEYGECLENISSVIESAFTAMKNALVSRDPICIFSDNFGATGRKKYTHVRDIN